MAVFVIAVIFVLRERHFGERNKNVASFNRSFRFEQSLFFHHAIGADDGQDRHKKSVGRLLDGFPVGLQVIFFQIAPQHRDKRVAID